MSWTTSLLSLVVALQMPPGGKSADKPLDIRVGIVAFEDFRGEFDHSEQLLAELAAAVRALVGVAAGGGGAIVCAGAAAGGATASAGGVAGRA
jgi:hypothetical protein